MAKKPQYVQSFEGRNYLRFRRHPLITLPPGVPSGPVFMAAYKVALAAARAAERPAPTPNPRRGKKKQVTSSAPKSPEGDTVRDAVTDYMASSKFRGMKPGTRASWTYLLDGWVKEYGDRLFASIKRSDIKKAVDERKPGSARNLLVALRDIVRLRIEDELMTEDDDPIGNVKAAKLPNKDIGFLTWDQDHLDMYRAFWPSGTPQRLALEVLYHTGAACADAIRLSRGMVKGRLVEFRREKTGEACYPQFTAALQAELAACDLTETVGVWLRTEKGKRFEKAHYFSQIFSRWAMQAGLPTGYCAHGIRKRAATDDAERLWTHTQMMVKYGWSTFEMADLYIKPARNRRIALAGIDDGDQTVNEKLG